MGSGPYEFSLSSFELKPARPSPGCLRVRNDARPLSARPSYPVLRVASDCLDAPHNGRQRSVLERPLWGLVSLGLAASLHLKGVSPVVARFQCRKTSALVPALGIGSAAAFGG